MIMSSFPTNKAISPLEKLLLSHARTSFIDFFFSMWTLGDLLLLGATSFTLHNIIYYYIHRGRDVGYFLSEWFRRPSMIARHFHENTALVFGRNVLRFFYGHVDPVDDLQICVTLSALRPLVDSLKQQHYGHYVSRDSGPADFDTTLTYILRKSNHAKLSCTAERCADVGRLETHDFLFRRSIVTRCGDIQNRYVSLRLIRCEPYRYVLSAHSSKSIYPLSITKLTIMPSSHLLWIYHKVVRGTPIWIQFDDFPEIVYNTRGPRL
jgi:hypothetical protein